MIFVDELDRCSSSSAVRILNSIKIYLHLPGCITFVGADKNVLSAAVAREYGEGAADSEYIDKIIQVPFYLPPISEGISSAYVANLLPEELSACRALVVKAFGKNPRQVKRFANSLAIYHSLGAAAGIEEYRPEVMALLLLLQHTTPQVYRRLVAGQIEVTELGALENTSEEWVLARELLGVINMPGDVQEYLELSRLTFSPSRPLETRPTSPHLALQRQSVSAEFAHEGPPFVGRAIEFRQLTNVLQGLRTGVGTAVAVLGPKGIGKSRIMMEMARLADSEGVMVARVRCLPGDREIPGALLTDIARRLLVMPGAVAITSTSEAILRSLVPSLAGRGDHSITTDWTVYPGALGDALGDLLAAIAYEFPIVLFIDDFHWADPLSSTVVTWLCQQAADHSEIIVLGLDPELADKTLIGRLDALQSAGSVSQMYLRPLILEDVTHLVTNLPAQGVEHDAAIIAPELLKQTGGNPRDLLARLFRIKPEA